MIQWIVLGAIALVGAAILTGNAIKKMLHEKLGRRGWMFAEIEEITQQAYSTGKRVKLRATSRYGQDTTVYVDADKIDPDEIYEGGYIIN